MADLKVGDVVRLKSGGPKMTISERPAYYAECCSSSLGQPIEPKDWKTIYCIWFEPIFPGTGDMKASGRDGSDCYGSRMNGEFSPESLDKCAESSI